MATEIKKESERTRELAERIAAQEAAKPGDWTGGTYGQQIDDALGKILNRQPFSYNLNADPLYNQYKDQYIRGGKLAMQDTMGQAAQLTGGYGNSYASTAGNQAYQGYLTGLNDKVPDLYSLALSKFNAEGDAMRDNLGLLQGMQQQELDQYNRKMTEYRTELDRLDALFSESQKYDYQNARDAIADAQWQAEFDEAVRQWNATHSGGGGGGGGGRSYTGYTPPPDETADAPADVYNAILNDALNTVRRDSSMTQAATATKKDVAALASSGVISQNQANMITAKIQAVEAERTNKSTASIKAEWSKNR